MAAPLFLGEDAILLLGEERLAGDQIRIDARLLAVPEMVVEGRSVPHSWII
jgi:hypothetical protein